MVRKMFSRPVRIVLTLVIVAVIGLFAISYSDKNAKETEAARLHAQAVSEAVVAPSLTGGEANRFIVDPDATDEQKIAQLYSELYAAQDKLDQTDNWIGSVLPFFALVMSLCGAVIAVAFMNYIHRDRAKRPVQLV